MACFLPSSSEPQMSELLTLTPFLLSYRLICQHPPAPRAVYSTAPFSTQPTNPTIQYLPSLSITSLILDLQWMNPQKPNRLTTLEMPGFDRCRFPFTTSIPTTHRPAILYLSPLIWECQMVGVPVGGALIPYEAHRGWGNRTLNSNGI